MFVTTAIVGVSLQERAVALVGLGDEEVARAEPRVRAERVDLARRRRRWDRGRRRASTVATSEVVVVLPCEPAMATQYFTRISSASISARGMIGISSARARDDLGVVRLDRARVDDDVGPLDVLGAVADVDAHAERLEAARDVVRLQVRAGDLELERAQDLGEAAHADAADADEVHAAHATAEHQAHLR